MTNHLYIIGVVPQKGTIPELMEVLCASGKLPEDEDFNLQVFAGTLSLLRQTPLCDDKLEALREVYLLIVKALDCLPRVTDLQFHDMVRELPQLHAVTEADLKGLVATMEDALQRGKVSGKP